MRRIQAFMSVLAFSVVVLSSFAASIGDPAPKIEAKKWVQGGPVEIKEGQVTVVEFWATWCPPCRASIPHINELYKQFKDKGVSFVGVSNEKTKEVSSFIKNMGDKMQYPVAIGSDSMSSGYMEAFGVDGIPHAFVVDASGHIAWHGHPLDGLDQAVQAAVEKRDAAKPKVVEAPQAGAAVKDIPVSQEKAVEKAK